MIKCPTCKQPTDRVKTSIRGKALWTGCSSCVGSIVQGNANAAQYNRERMKRDYAGDIVQPNDPRGYIKANGIDKAREFYDDETIRRNA